MSSLRESTMREYYAAFPGEPADDPGYDRYKRERKFEGRLKAHYRRKNFPPCFSRFGDG